MGLVQPKLDALGRIGFGLSVIVVLTSMVDLLVNRLLFRSGPETLAHLDVPGLSEIAAAGRITFTFEQVAVFIILGATAFLLLRNKGASPSRLAMLILPQLATAALLYLSLGPELVWDLSLSLLSVTTVLILGFIGSRYRVAPGRPRRSLGERVFLLSLAATFGLVLYYRASVLVGSVGAVSLPLQMQAYTGGVAMAMVTSVAAFAYAVTVRSPGFRNSLWNIAKVLILPSIVVIPFLYGLMESYFMTQIFAMVIAMSTDIALSFNMVRLVILSSWFLLAAILLLLVKGRKAQGRFLVQQGMGLVLVLSASFLFNYANYVLLSTAGVLLITVPLLNSNAE